MPAVQYEPKLFCQLFPKKKIILMEKMKRIALTILCLNCVCRFIGADESVQVMEGDSVYLNTGVTKQQHELMRWYFNDILIALINGEATSCLYDGEGGRFRGRVVVDYETGSLTITNIRSEHAGRYEAELIRGQTKGKSTSLNRSGKCDRTQIREKSNIGDTIKTFIVSVSHTTNEEPEQEGRNQDSDKKADQSSGLSTDAVAGIVVAVLLVCVWLQLLV